MYCAPEYRLGLAWLQAVLVFLPTRRGPAVLIPELPTPPFQPSSVASPLCHA